MFLYTTRGCFGNPTRDRGRVIAIGQALTAVSELEEPVKVAGRSFPVGCEIEFREATAWPDGVELAPLVHDMDAFGNTEAGWSYRLRRPLVRLTDRDVRLLRHRFERLSRYPLADVLTDYARWWQPAQR